MKIVRMGRSRLPRHLTACEVHDLLIFQHFTISRSTQAWHSRCRHARSSSSAAPTPKRWAMNRRRDLPDHRRLGPTVSHRRPARGQANRPSRPREPASTSPGGSRARGPTSSRSASMAAVCARSPRGAEAIAIRGPRPAAACSPSSAGPCTAPTPRYQHIFLSRANGSRLRDLTPNLSSNLPAIDPEFSPDKARVAYSTGDRLLSVAVDGTRPRLLVPPRAGSDIPRRSRLCTRWPLPALLRTGPLRSLDPAPSRPGPPAPASRSAGRTARGGPQPRLADATGAPVAPPGGRRPGCAQRTAGM